MNRKDEVTFWVGIFSRGHATQHFDVSVRLSVNPSLFLIAGGYCINTPAWIAVYPVLIEHTRF